MPYAVTTKPARTDLSRVAGALALAGLLLAPLPGRAQNAGDEPLIDAASLVYEGGFRLPAGADTQSSYDYGGSALAYVPAHDSLLIVGHDWFQKVSEIGIPSPGRGASLDALPTAPVKQALTDLLGPHLHEIGPGTAKIGGLLPIGDQLVVSDYLYYDGAAEQTSSHFVVPLDFHGAPAPRGPFRVTNALGRAGFVSGAMTAIPSEWQAALGGPYITGQCCIGIVARTSLGPSATAFDPAGFSTGASVKGVTLLGYPLDRPTLGAWDSNSTKFNGTTSMGGVVFPPGTRTLLFIGRQGTGPFCYGAGTGDRTLAGKPVPGEGDHYCYDPAYSSKGTHGFPYVHQVWAYDADELAKVKAGKKDPWAVLPYAVWTLDLPFQTAGRQLGGIAYDPVKRRLFVVDAGVETANYANRPIIHVFSVVIGGRTIR